MTLSEELKQQAIDLGFSLVGIAPANEADSFSHYEGWLDNEFNGEMTYLAKKRPHRQHPRSILKSVRSVVMVAMEYGGGTTHESIPAQHGRVARYAQGGDYHRAMWDRLNDLETWLIDRAECETVAVTDTAPLLERDFSRRAGLGWVGKNTMLINPKRGSFFFLGALLTSLELPADSPFETNHCGTCTACLDVCPTDAFPEPSVLDARKCISYLTIELRSPILDDLKPKIEDWLFGCDLCQEVCPWNRFAGSPSPSFPHDSNWTSIDCVRLLDMTDDQFRFWFKGTSLVRTKRDGLQRNAAIVLGNTGDESALPALTRSLQHDSETVRDAVRWAIEQIRLRSVAGKN